MPPTSHNNNNKDDLKQSLTLAWEKRRKQRIKQQKEVEKKDQIKEKTDATTVTSPKQSSPTLFQLKDKSEDKIRKENNENNSKNIKQQTRLKELSCKLEKLYHLRNLRRKKLEAKGHFFPEDDNEFFNKIKTSIKEEEMKMNDYNDNNKQTKQNDNSQSENDEPFYKINDDDQWQQQPLDQCAYQYWSQGWQSTTALKNIRKQWDLYLINNDDVSRATTPIININENVFKIPPGWVSPPLPSHPIWESYLEKKESGV
ncbi:unnamed protein product [Cunninghamella blakesleeana]